MKREKKILTLTWGVLMALTLGSAFVAERVSLSNLIVVVICTTVAIKGSLVIDRLMGLRIARPVLRWAMLSYFLILPPIITLAVLFPETLLRYTSL